MVRRARGSSLIELLIASGLIGICLLGILALAQSGSRYMMVTNAKVEMQNSALLLSRHLFEEFSETNDGSFEVGAPYEAGQTNRGVVFISPRSPVSGEIDTDLYGRLKWQKVVAYYARMDAGIPCVVRAAKGFPLGDPKCIPGSDPPYRAFVTPCEPLDTFLAGVTQYSVEARNAVEFDCKGDAANLTFKVHFEMPSGYGRRYGFVVSSQVFARN